MSLLIPQEFINNLNQYTGQIDAKSPYAKKNLKGLWKSRQNAEYLASQLFMLLTNPTFVSQNLALPTEDSLYSSDSARVMPMGRFDQKTLTLRIIKTFSTKKKFILDAIDELIDTHPIPFDEDLFTANPIMQLHNLNKQFLLQSGNNLVQCPESVDQLFYSVNPETGNDESQIEYDYTSASFSDGTWHPEHLFSNSIRNRESGYWVPQKETPIYANYDGTGLGYRYNTRDHYNAKSDNSGLYATSERTRSQFPRWQSVGSNWGYDRHNEESMDEGKLGDRRVQTNRGYNMRNLITKSTY